MLKRTLTTLTVAVALSGCMASSSGPIPFGPDTYMISSESELGGAGAAKKKGLVDANAHCISLGKNMMPINYQTSTQIDFLGDRIPSFDLTYRCLSNSDYELQRPNMKKEADIVIESN